MPQDIDVTRGDIVTALHVRGEYGYESPDGYRCIELQDATDALMERDDATELMTALFQSLSSQSATDSARIDAATQAWEHEVERLADKALMDMERWHLLYYRRTA